MNKIAVTQMRAQVGFHGLDFEYQQNRANTVSEMSLGCEKERNYLYAEQINFTTLSLLL